MTKLEQIIKEDLPAMLTLLKAKFADTAKNVFSTFYTEQGELLHEGALAVGADVFVADGMDACILKKKEAGMSAAEAKAECGKGDYKKIPAPDKTYKHEDGTEITVQAGKVIDVKKPAVPAKTDMTAMVQELFKAFPKTDLTIIEASLAELKTTLASIQTERADMKAKVDKFDSFKTEVIGILDKFSKSASASTAPQKKNDSTKSIFNSALTMEERVKALNETAN